MSAKIPMSDLAKAATDFALPQISIVKPRLVICLGLATFTAVSLACSQSVPAKMATAIESPFQFEDSLIYCQSHPGHFGRINRNRGGVDRAASRNLDKRHMRHRRWDGQPVFAKSLHVQSDRLLNQLFHFFTAIRDGDAPWKVWHARAETGGALFDEDGVGHRVLPLQSKPACR